jgi:tetratricopeptide (TPR) repeat protein
MTKAYLPRATAYQLASHFDEALADIARADGHASPGALALIRGHCHYGRGEWSEAKTAYREHLRVDPSSDHRDLVLANLRQCDARLESATSDF